MNDTIVVALIGFAATLLAAGGGWLLSFLQAREAKRKARLEKRLLRLDTEVRVRIAMENAACHWFSELTGRSARSIQIELRDRAEALSGLRPKLALSRLVDVPATTQSGI